MSKDIFKTCLDMWCSQTRENCFYFLSTPVDKIFCSDWSWKLRVKDTNVPADHTGQDILLVNTVPSTLIPVHWLMAHVLAMLVWALQCHLSCYNQGHDWVSTDRVNPMMWVLGRFGTQCPIHTTFRRLGKIDATPKSYGPKSVCFETPTTSSKRHWPTTFEVDIYFTQEVECSRTSTTVYVDLGIIILELTYIYVELRRN